MSDWEEKLELRKKRPDDNIARQTLAQLRKRWGAAYIPDDAPDVIRVSSLGKVELWRKALNGSRGEGTTYELVERRNE